MAPLSSSETEHNFEVQWVERSWPLTDEGIYRRVRGYRDEAHHLWNAIHVRARQDHRYAGGQHYPESVERYAREKGLPRLIFDKVTPLIDTMVSRMSMRRFRPTVIADRVELAALAEPLDLAMAELRRRGRAEFALADAFRDLWTTGIGAVSIGPYWRNSRQPKIKYQCHPLWEIMVDPLSREQNFADRTWHQRHRYFTRQQLEERYGRLDGFSDTFKTFYQLWKATGSATSESYWPTSLNEVWTGSGDAERIALTTSEWRDVEPYYEITLDAELDAQVQERLLAGGSKPGEDQVLEALIDSVLQVQGMTRDELEAGEVSQETPPPTGTRPEEMARLPWKLSEKRYEAFRRIWQVAGLGEFKNWWLGERDVFKFADTVGDLVVVNSGRIPENFWRQHFLTDVMVKQPEGYLPRCYLRGVQDRQNFINMSMSGMVEVMSSWIKAVMVDEHSFDQTTQAEADLGNPRKVVKVKGNPNDKVREPTPPRLDGHSTMLQAAQQVHSEESISPYEQGAAGSSGDLRRTSRNALTTLMGTAQEKHAARFDALRRFHLDAEGPYLLHALAAHWSWDSIVHMVGMDKVTVDQPDPETGENVPTILFPRDRREWLTVLEYGITLDEKEVTPQEAEERFHKLFIDQGGLLATLTNRPEFPEPRVLAEALPDALAGVLGARGSLYYEQQLQRLQKMMDAQMNQPAAPPEGGGPQQ